MDPTLADPAGWTRTIRTRSRKFEVILVATLQLKIKDSVQITSGNWVDAWYLGHSRSRIRSRRGVRLYEESLLTQVGAGAGLDAV